jgi:hypothetical protein
MDRRGKARRAAAMISPLAAAVLCHATPPTRRSLPRAGYCSARRPPPHLARRGPPGPAAETASPAGVRRTPAPPPGRSNTRLSEGRLQRRDLVSLQRSTVVKPSARPPRPGTTSFAWPGPPGARAAHTTFDRACIDRKLRHYSHFNLSNSHTKLADVHNRRGGHRDCRARTHRGGQAVRHMLTAP